MSALISLVKLSLPSSGQGAQRVSGFARIVQRFNKAIAASKNMWEKIVLRDTLAQLRSAYATALPLAIDALGTMKAKAAAPILMKLASHPKNMTLRSHIIVALGKMRSKQAIPLLKAMYGRSNVSLLAKKLIIIALGRIEDPSTISFLKNIAFHDRTSGLATVALGALVMFPLKNLNVNKQFIGHLAKLLHSNDFVARRTAALMLGFVKDVRAAPELISILTSTVRPSVSAVERFDPSLQYVQPLLARIIFGNTAGGVAQQQAARALKIVARAMSTIDRTRISAKDLSRVVVALSTSKHPAATSLLRALIVNNNAHLSARRLAIQVLAKKGDRKVLPALRRISKNVPALRRPAQRAIDIIKRGVASLR